MSEMDPATDRKVANLMAKVRRLEKGLSQLSSATTARRTSIDSGPGLVIRDGEGKEALRLGPNTSGDVVLQHIAGRTPTQPETPEAQAVAGAISLSLSGLDVEGSPAQADVPHARVYASLEEGFEPWAGSFKGTVPVAGDSPIMVPAPGVWHLRVVWRSLSGEVGPPSAPVTVEVEPLVDSAEIEAALEAARTDLAAATEQAEKDLAELDKVLREAFGDADAALAGRVDSQDEAVQGAVQDAASALTEAQTGEVSLDRLRDATVMDEAVVGTLWSKLSVTERLVAVQAWIGGAMLQDGAVTAEKITATEELTAKVAQFLQVRADQIEVNDLVASTAFLTALEASQARFRGVTGDLTTTVSGDGLMVTQTVEESGEEMPVTYVGGSGEVSISTYNRETGMVLGGIGADGSLTGAALSVETDPIIAGTPLVGEATHEYLQNAHGEMAMLESMPWGVIAHVQRSTANSGPWGARNEYRFLQLNAQVRSDRMYILHTRTGRFNVSGGTYMSLRTRRGWAQDAKDPDATSHEMDIWGATDPKDNLDRDELWQPPLTGEVRLLFTIHGGNNWSFINGPGWQNMRMWLEDVGPAIEPSGYDRNGFGSAAGGGGGTDDRQAPVTRYSTAWPGGGLAVYMHGGSTRQTSGANVSRLMQGRNPHWTAGGIQSSYFWLANNASAGDHSGQSRSSALAGATMRAGTLSIWGEYSPHVSGGTAQRRINVYQVRATSADSSFRPAASSFVASVEVPPGQRRNINLPTSVLNGIRDGSINGFGFSTASDGWLYSHGLSWRTRPFVTLKYDK